MKTLRCILCVYYFTFNIINSDQANNVNVQVQVEAKNQNSGWTKPEETPPLKAPSNSPFPPPLSTPFPPPLSTPLKAPSVATLHTPLRTLSKPLSLNPEEPEDLEKYSCLRKVMETESSKVCFDDTIKILKSDKYLELYYEAAAYRGDPMTNFRLSVVDIHLFMRENYAQAIEKVGRNIFPLLVATDSEPELMGTGGVWKVYFRNGTMKRIAPVERNFEIYKSLSHILLGIFTIISPYFNSPNSINWKPKLAELNTKIQAALYTVPESGYHAEEAQTVTKMLNLASTYINNCLKKQKAIRKDYEDFSAQYAPYMDLSLKVASEAHVAATIPALKQLKREMGDGEWERMFVVIPTAAPLALSNIKIQMLQQVMDFKQMSEQVLIAEGAKTEADARITLGRVILNRALAQMTFGSGSPSPFKNDFIFALSDKMGFGFTEESIAIDKYCEGSLEPVPENSDNTPTSCPQARPVPRISPAWL